MTPRLHLAVLLLSLTAAAQPNRPGRLNPPYLSEMPTVARVLQEITAPAPLDAAARRAGAFEQLHEIIDEFSGPRRAMGTYTPDEASIMSEYRTAKYTAITAVHHGPQDDHLLPALRRFDEDPALRDELLNRFFSPAFRAQSIELSRRLNAGRATLRQQNAAFGGTAAPRPNAAAPAPTPRPAAPAAKPPLPPDPSIARAQAAGVDTKVFGMQLGDRVNLPNCGFMGSLVTTQNCITELHGLVNDIAALQDPSLGGTLTIKLARDSCPEWLPDCLVTASVENERLIGVTLQPKGASVERATATELLAKYGARATRRQRTITPLEGGTQFQVWDLEWHFPGLHVLYRPVHATVHYGIIYIESDRAYQKRQAAQQRATRPKL